jgi:hypothetical protein
MPGRLRYPHSFAEANLNSPQETGSMRARLATSMLSMKTTTASVAVEPFRRRSGLAVFLVWHALLAAFWISATVVAQAAVVLTVPHTTVVVFADHPLPKSEWPSLFTAIRSVLADVAAETQAVDINAELVEGDAVVPGLRVDASLSVYLHGDCNFELQPPRGYPGGATLGWVWQRQGTIDPFVHVDCTSIGQLLEPGIYWFSKDQRIHAMAGAIARVIVHEWIHIATQSAGHSGQGVTKAHFGIDDLLPERDRSLARLRNSR